MFYQAISGPFIRLGCNVFECSDSKQDIQNEPLKTVLKEVENQTGFSIIYKNDEVEVDRKVNASFQNATLNEVMSKILGNQQLTWIMQDKMIIISKKGKEKTSQRGKL